MPGLQALRVEHLPAVLAIERAANAHPWSEANLRDSLAAGYPGWVSLDDDGVPAGYAIALIAAGEAQVLNVGVDPGRQRRGHGRRLLAALIAAAQAAACELVLLEVRRSNAAAIALYEGLGFAAIGVRKRYYRSGDGIGEDAIVMSLPLAAPMPAGL